MVGGPAQPARVGRVFDDAGPFFGAAIEIDPPEGDRPDEGGHKGGDLGPIDSLEARQRRAHDDDRFTER